MKLKEYEGKAIFKKYGIKVPKSYLIKNIKEVKNKDGNFIVKAQVLVGKRKKSGLIKKANNNNLKSIIRNLLNKKIKDIKINEVLVEELIPIEKEIYVSLTIDRFSKSIVCIVSAAGGIDIEEVAKKYPNKIIKFPIIKFNKKEINKNIKKLKLKIDLTKIVEKMFKIMKDYDADLVEINPLVISNHKLIALDSKITIDDASLFRHEEFKRRKDSELTKIEKEAFAEQLQYVELDGNVAVCGNGAGMVMATMDILNYYGIKPANFLDIGAGATINTMEQALRIMLMKKCRLVFINIFGGMTKCDEMALGIIRYIDKYKVKTPFVVRMVGTNQEKARELLETKSIHTLNTIEESAKKIIKLIK